MKTFLAILACVFLVALQACTPATTSAGTYKVTYDGNASTGGSPPVDSASYSQGATVTVLGNTGNLTNLPHTFLGWNTKADGSGTAYSAGSTFTIGSADMRLYANWPTSSAAASVTSMAPSELADSGATTTPNNLTSINAMINALGADTAASTQLQTVFTDLGNYVSAPPAGTIKTSIDNFTTQLKSFPSAKSASMTVDLSNTNIGQYVTVNAGSVASATLVATTTAGDLLSDFSNFRSASGAVFGLINGNLVSLPGGSVVATKVRVNFGADATFATDIGLNAATLGTPANLTLSLGYKISASAGLSIKEGTTGGKLVVTIGSQYTKSKVYQYPTSDSLTIFNDFLGTTAPYSVTVTVYTDAGVQTFTQTYTSVNALQTDFPKL